MINFIAPFPRDGFTGTNMILHATIWSIIDVICQYFVHTKIFALYMYLDATKDPFGRIGFMERDIIHDGNSRGSKSRDKFFGQKKLGKLEH
ncbi:hypothetical protein BX616_008474 [Lobosporangium transversale]|nr:hypothetical protein BX616_008474 [Lobosporangium transversale]